MSAYGIEPDDIAKYLGLSVKTLLKYHAKDISRAKVEANMKVNKTLFEMAIGGGAVAATIFWSKTRCGFHERQAHDAGPAVIPNFVVSQEKKAA
ncbi:MAG TPA: hypothetical protein VK752_10050 [Bryobacteraceae bacterium]|nr:hypothetical protein [Bryobacteraceae bacterium]